jgi:hypothetical protein
MTVEINQARKGIPAATGSRMCELKRSGKRLQEMAAEALGTKTV